MMKNKKTKITFHSGVLTIGGTIIEIEYEDSHIFFDFGSEFNPSASVQPSDLQGLLDNNLVPYLDNIFDGLMDGGGKYQLTKLNDQKYQKKLVELNKSWISLKEEIQKVREDGYENTNIIEMSENYFYLADETVDAAEEYSQYCLLNLI